MSAIFGIKGSYRDIDIETMTALNRVRAGNAVPRIFQRSEGFIGSLSFDDNCHLQVMRDERPIGFAVWDGYLQHRNCPAFDWNEWFAKFPEKPDLSEICGLHAFAFWDQDSQTLYLSRDPSGARPLYYFLSKDGTVLFGSRLKSLFSSGHLSRELNPRAVSHYLSMIGVPDPETIYQDARSVPSGTLLKISRSEVRIERYFSMKTATSDTDQDTLQCRLRESLEQSVIGALPNDMDSTGFFLSGGSDTTTVVGLVSRAGISPIHTFTIGYKGFGEGYENYNEFEYAKSVSERYGTIHHENYITPDKVLKVLPKIVAGLDQPSGDAINSYLVSETLPANIKFVLTGTGGDEIFVGSQWFLEQQKLIQRHEKWSKIPGSIRWLIIQMISVFRFDSIARKIKNMELLKKGVTERYRQIKFVFKNQEKLWSPGFRDRIEGVTASELVDEYSSFMCSKDEVNALIGLLFEHEVVNIQSRDLDVMCHMHGREARSPLIDRRVLDALTVIPGHLKFRDNQLRSFMHKTLADIIPESTICRRKMSFIVPMDLWARRELRSVIDHLLSPETIRRRGIFEPGVISEVYLDYYQRDRERHPFKIWLLSMLELWCRFHLDAPLDASPPENISDLL